MITIDSLTANTYDIDQITLEWEFEPTNEVLSDYTLDVYRSETPGVSGITEYDIIASGISVDDYMYNDVSISGLYDHNRTWYYKLKITNTANQNTSVGPDEPAYINSTLPDYRSRYMIEWKKRGLNQFVGQDLFLLKRRTWGVRCEAIWDETLQRVTSDRCEGCNCYGTGWEGGYFNPIPFKGMINNNPKIDEITPFGEFKPSDALLNCLPYPPIRPSDIIVFKNERYYAIQVQQTERLGVAIEQQVQISLIHPDDETYNIPIG